MSHARWRDGWRGQAGGLRPNGLRGGRPAGLRGTRGLNRLVDGCSIACGKGRNDLVGVGRVAAVQRRVDGDARAPDFVNRLLRTNFAIMDDLGPRVLKPFNQDVVQPRGLLAVLAQATLRDPLNIPKLVPFHRP